MRVLEIDRGVLLGGLPRDGYTQARACCYAALRRSLALFEMAWYVAPWMKYGSSSFMQGHSR